MTNVVVQHLVSNETMTIKCRDLVKKIAVYKNRLAVRFSACMQPCFLATPMLIGEGKY